MLESYLELGGGFENSIHENDKILLIETNIDDMNPEHFDLIIEKILDSGALDVFITPIIMKKSRPAQKLTVITTDENADKIRDVIFKETTSIGVREIYMGRTKLKREDRFITTHLGNVKIKLSFINEDIIRIKPESDDIKRICKKEDLSYQETKNLIVKKFISFYGKENNKIFLY